MTSRNTLFGLSGLMVGLLAASQMPLHAQRPPQQEAAPPTPVGTAALPPVDAKVPLQEALIRPYAFQFPRPTPLDQVARKLSADLGGEVVVDIAALQRLDLDKDEPVELELRNGRLKTGLKLLLDQVGMTYRLIPEDNLLIFTDEEGSEDPLDRIWNELSGMHREIHDIQDALDELLDLSESREDGRLRQPTIIEEMPGEPGDVPAAPNVEPEPSPSTPRRPRT